MKETIHIVKAVRNWYALRTNEQFEKKVAGNLLRKHIETFLPVMKVTAKHWDGNSFTLYAPVFPSLVFVHISDVEINEVLHTKGVANFLFWRNKYAIISKEDIITIRDFCSENDSVWVEKCEIATEDFQNENDLSGIVVNDSMQGKQVQRVYLSTLGYSLTAFVPGKRQVKLMQNVS